MKCAVIDISSNTITLCVYKVEQEKTEQLFSVKETAGLAGYIKDRKMSRQGEIRLTDVLNKFMSILEPFEIDRISVFAASALRNIKNAKEVTEYVLEKTGKKLDLLSGRDEAAYGFYGVQSQYPVRDGLIFDIGGGSTQIVTCMSEEPCLFESVELGSLNLYYRCVKKILPGKSEIEQMERKIKKEFRYLFGCRMCMKMHSGDQIIGSGGTGRAILQIVNHLYGKEKDNSVITDKELEELFQMGVEKSRKLQKLILKLCPDRVHTLIPGMLIIRHIVSETKSRQIYISSCGVREGYLLKKILAGDLYTDEKILEKK